MTEKIKVLFERNPIPSTSYVIQRSHDWGEFWVDIYSSYNRDQSCDKYDEICADPGYASSSIRMIEVTTEPDELGSTT